MRDDTGRGTGEPEESRDGSWNGPSGDDGWDDPADDGSDAEYYNQEYEDVAVDEEAGERSDERSSGNVAGEFHPSESIEPGDPSLENSLFVVFGAYVAILGLTRLFIDVQGFDAQDLLVLTGGTLLAGIVLFGFLGLLTPDT
jgi:hypothetical protein